MTHRGWGFIRNIRYYAIGNSTFLDILSLHGSVLWHKQVEKRGKRLFMRMKKRSAIVVS